MRELAGKPADHRSYDPEFFGRLFGVEDRHFWFRARNRAIAAVIRQIEPRLQSGYRVLEMGCGTGNVLRVLERYCARGAIVGMDLFAEGLRYARRRTSCLLVQGDVHAPPFSARFDLIGLFDLLEHLADDVSVLRSIHDMLAGEGTLLLTVPAHPSLWSYFDAASHHRRRYAPAELERKLSLTGYRVEYLTQYMASIYPWVWLRRAFSALVDRCAAGDVDRAAELASNELRVRPVLNELLVWLLSAEARLIARRRRLPIGTSLLAVARKHEAAAA